MIPPALPADEQERLESLNRLNVLDTPPEEHFDRIVRVARRLFDVPIVAISLVDKDRQWFKSIEGLDVRQTPRAISFCGHAILEEDALVVNDACQDPRFSDNPLVVSEPYIRFYAGQPITGPNERRVGTLCLIDRRPRTMNEADLALLRDLARMVENEIQLVRMSSTRAELISRLAHAERRALHDPLTQMWNRQGILRILEKELEAACLSGTTLSIQIVDIDHFKSINDERGHAAGDAVLRGVAQRLRASIRQSDAAGRLGGDEFLLIHPGADQPLAVKLAKRGCKAVAQQAIPLEAASVPEALVTSSAGVATLDPSLPEMVHELLRRADAALYRAKLAGRNRVETGSTVAKGAVESGGQG